ncbi:16S rRNA (guanine(527)-N(7))-methyltransferase RsmG [Cellulomonas sp.]|uniref:16S rRNA (guanine(527)-N(7))-methyltransferase RsmG n=1 Tax=Cellulomonas sp. TaxID=40001 RepID=UPI002D4A52E7|nr:16S rRNA (guanine(527)-N(7))-methyltransferase RsmG [Cellulomonas sp.]HYQ75011.1 16S rRNA (guanine(527)-N(7))-methyltransferase RsmG [Cellulomonas sp.]
MRPESAPARDDERPDAPADPLDGDPRLPEHFGRAWPAVHGFHDMLRDQGVLRGLVGPRELARLWERHVVNSAAVVPFLPETGTIVDVGSGAGLPGIVVAAMRPDAEVVLLEPMERRTDWLTEVVQTLGLSNARVVRGRAEDQVGTLRADAVTARAVAALDKLYPWTLPLLAVGGRLVALKGGRARDEADAAVAVGERFGGGPATIEVAPTLPGLEPTSVVLVTRTSVGTAPTTAPQAARVSRGTEGRSRRPRRSTKGQGA